MASNKEPTKVPPVVDTMEEEDDEDRLLFGGVFNIEISPAFKFLESQRGKQIPDEKIDELKSKMRSLYSHLRRMIGYERGLVQKCKSLKMDVNQQRLEIDRTGLRQFSDNSEIGELKRDLVKIQNEANLALDRENKLSRDIEDSSRFKQELIDDIEEIRKHKADMLEPQLIASTKEIKLEVLQRQHQLENLKKDLEEKTNTYELVMKEKERLEIDKEKLSITLDKATEMPQKIFKQAEVLRDAINSLTSESAKQNQLGIQLDKDFERLSKRKEELDEIKLDLTAEFEQRRAEMFEMERYCDDIFRDHESTKERLSEQKSDRVRLEIGLKKVASDIKREHDVLMRTLREKETAVKTFRRLVATVNNVKQSIPSLRTQGNEFKRQYEVTVRETQHYKNEIQELKKKIDLAMYDFLQSEQAEKKEKEELVHVMNVNKRLEEQLEETMNKSHSLAKEAESLALEKELRARDLIKVQNKVRALKDDLKVKNSTIVDTSSRCNELGARLQEFVQLYNIVKNDRNKYVNLIQATHQRAAEMQEKIRILSNEVEILRNEISHRDHELMRKHQENTSAYSLRDTVRNEANRLLVQYRDRRDQIDQHLSRIETLNTLINAAEEDMLNLKKRYEESVKERNSVGIQLLDRNDELCILYEKLNIQESVMSKGEKELLERDEDIRKLKLCIAELEREVDMRKRLLPEAWKHHEEIEKIEKELEKTRQYVVELSAQIEDPNNSERVRILEGKDPNQKELLEKIAKLEAILAAKEERLLEKDLVLEEITVLTQRLKKQTLDGREETAEVAQKLNELTKKIKHVTKAMMAKVSELSMNQAMAMTLYKEKCEKEALLKESQERVEKGEPPSEEIEMELIKLEQRRALREKEMKALLEKRRQTVDGQASVEVDEDNFFVYNNIRTKAEPRPNAYLPTSGLLSELPIPKPYGAYAPFKPQEPGAQMRHIRKPVIKPIEI